MINKSLAEKRGLCIEDQEKINDLHAKIQSIISSPRTHAKTPDEIPSMIESIEFELQALWRFDQIPVFHRYWLHVAGCSCPFYDNMEAIGHHRIINGECPYHGDRPATDWGDERFFGRVE